MSLPPAYKTAVSKTPGLAGAATVSVATLTVGDDDVVTQDDQLGGDVVITGTLTGLLAAGGAVDIVLPNGQIRQATVSADGVSFSLTVTAAADLADFSVANAVSAYVAGAPAAAVTQAFTAASQRSFQPVTATPADPTAAAVSTIALSRDGSTVAFVSLGAFADGVQPASLYVQQLATGVTTLVTDQADVDFGTGVAGPSLSGDGRLLAYAAADPIGGGQEFFLKDLQTGATTVLGSAYYGGSPSLADDGTAVFQGQENGATVQQIYAARVTAGVVSLQVVSAPDPADGGAQTTADAISDQATVSADGSVVVFRSAALNLLASGDPDASSLTGDYQIYAKALRDDAATGLHAGQVVLVSLTPGGAVSDGSDIAPVVSGDGRLVVFVEATDGQTYLRDLATGTTTLVSDSAAGVAADAATRDATISADGRTVAFRSAAFNLLDPTDPAYATVRGHTEIYEKDLASGKVTLLSEAGYIEGDNSSFTPSLSADGSKVAFVSYADNLATGLGPDTDPTTGSAAELGFVTSGSTPPTLTFNPPVTPFDTPTALLSGTIDAADAGRTITLADAGDAGFTVGPVTVAATSDPYTDSWSATATFSETGAQTVTASVYGGSGALVSQARTFDVSFTPRVLILPSGLNATVTVSPLSTAVTTFSGTAAGAAGQTLSLSLRQAGGNLLKLGSAVVGAGGAWSIGLADKSLAQLGSGDDSLVASVAGADGATSLASQAVSLAVVPTATLYSFRFTFKDGSFYTGTVAGGGNYAYSAGQTIATAAGSYAILSAEGPTADAAGTVRTSQYYDAATAALYVPVATAAGDADGGAGLGSESDAIDGPMGRQTFGAGATEAKEAAATLYDYTFVYDNGSAYTGTVAAGGAYVYAAGQTIAGSGGFYTITSSAGATTDAPGTVRTSLYYDDATTRTYVPVLAASGATAGTLGLGSETDSVADPKGSTTFGLAGKDEALLRIAADYQFTFTYKDGSYYRGTVTDDGTKGYRVGQKIVTSAGTYDIYASSLDPGATAGIVTVGKYYDVSTKEFYTPYVGAGGLVFGAQGLQSEFGQVDTPVTEGFGWYVGDGQLISVEARAAAYDAFQFTFTYNDGSYYTGEVSDNGSALSGDGYAVGDEFGNTYGHYTITKALGSTTETSGNVYVDTYYDVSTNQDYTPEGHGKGPDGTAGLGSELDTTDGDQGSQKFGQFGAFEARQSPRTFYSFLFDYKDGSYYNGRVVADASSNYHAGLVIKTSYGFYEITGAAAGVTNAPYGEVLLDDYYDATSQLFQQPVSQLIGPTSVHGLGVEIGYVNDVPFGEGGALEARLGGYTTYNFTFFYYDGFPANSVFSPNSYYSGTVTDDSSHHHYIGEQIETDYGIYLIGSGASNNKKDDPGTVRVNYYHDLLGSLSGVPGGAQQGLASGAQGLGSELDTIDGRYFGEGGLFEAGSERYLYKFNFTYSDGAFYEGYVAGLSYYVGEDIGGTGGAYTILSQQPTNEQNGAVSVFQYDDPSFKQYTPYRFTQGLTAGTSGLGSELDYIASAGGYVPFGFGGEYEAHPISNSVFALNRFTDLAVFDGPIAGATVGYLDGAAPPGTLAIDPNQPTATTRADGGYTLSAGVGPLVLTGGTDAFTGLAFRGVLSSAGQSPAISPLTTLIEAVAVAKGDTTTTGVAAADALVVGAFKLPTGLDLTSYVPGAVLQDPASSAADVRTAEAVYRAGASLLDAQTLIDAAGGSGWTALEQTARALADGSVADLTDLSAVIDRGGLAPDADAAVRVVDAATDAFLGLQLDGVTAPRQILEDVAGASIALQGDASGALKAAPAGGLGAAATDYVTSLAATLRADDQRALANQAACYVRGTAILTGAGERPVETLEIGMIVATHDGPPMPIRWIGRRSYGGPFLARNPHLQPILFRAGAIADGVPRHDLRVSPKHAMFLDGVLVPAECLVNGVSILRDADAAEVGYFHVELETHSVILAEGAPSETFVDDDSRMMFHNAGEFFALHPDEPRRPARYCAPRIEDGEELERIRGRLARRAARPTEPAPPGRRVRGRVDEFGRDRVRGWAWNEAAPGEPVMLRVLDNGEVIARIVADAYRADLLAAGIGDGRHAFDFAFPGGLSPLVAHRVRVEREADGASLENGGGVIEALGAGDRRRGHLDTVDHRRIVGWAWDAARPDQPVTLQIVDNGRLIAQVVANRHRPDLERAGVGHGRHGFEFEIPGGLSALSAHTVHVRYAADGLDLAQSPAFVAIPAELDEALQRDIANALGGACRQGDPERVLSFLAAQAERVLQTRADADSRRELRGRHQRLLRRQDAPDPDAAADAPGLRALVVDDHVPAAGRDAGSQAILSHMRSLQELGYAVSFVASQDLQARGDASRDLEAAGVALCRSPFYASVEEVLARQSGGFDLVYLHRVSNASRYLNLARQHLPRARIVFGVADLQHVRIARQAAAEDRPELLASSRALKFAEYAAAAAADAVITHSPAEAALLRRDLPGANVHVAPWALPIRSARTPFSGRAGIAFIGNYAHAPNLDAAWWLIREIMPLVRQRNPRIECLLVGGDMPRELMRAAHAGVQPIGAVADLSEVFERVRLTVAPLRFGAGVKGKVLESLSAGIPCVMTPVAAEGIALPRSLSRWVGATPAEVASRIVRLHAGRAAYREAAEAGRALVRSSFGSAAVTEALARAVCENPPSRTADRSGRASLRRTGAV
jgi:Tol biopolymer transport system component/glycosyltransferase involved in cell wall biosynthesis